MGHSGIKADKSTLYCLSKKVSELLKGKVFMKYDCQKKKKRRQKLKLETELEV